jgi:PKD repeat protein
MNEEDFPQIGDVIIYGTDTMTANITVGSGGEDQVWDFSGLTATSTSFQSFVDPVGTPSESEYPNADYAISSQGFFTYVAQIDDQIEILGLSLDIDGTGTFTAFPFTETQTVAVLPTTYGTIYQDTFAFDVTLEGDPAQGVDSVRVKQISYRDTEIDGYGTLITPNGEFEALRQIDTIVTYDTTWAYAPFLGGWFLVSEGVTNSADVQWLTREAKGPMITLGFTEMGDINAVTFAQVFPLPVADFSIDETSNGTYAFTDLSTNSPNQWLWDFGDGNTSTEQNPDHTYATPGTYEICLTVTNNAGSVTTCQTIAVVLIPVADFEFMDDGIGTVTFTDVSINEPTSWSWDFGDGNMSTEQNPVHTYSATGNYTVCLRAINSAGDNVTCQDLGVVSTLEENGIVNLSIFPNPAADFLKIEFENLYGNDFELIFTNSVGQNIFQTNLNNNMTIDVQGWAKGYYNYQILNADGEILKVDKIFVVK